MGRRARPPKGKADAKRPLAGKTPKDEGAKVRDLEKSLAESLERETATGEILRVISQSPTEVQPVFDAIVRSGAALCHAPDVIISIADGDSLRLVASVGSVAASVEQSQLLQGGRMPLTRGSVSGRAIIDRHTVHVHDVSAMPDDEFPEGKVLQREYGGRGTTLAVPLLREDVALGAITLLRNEVSPFTDRQIALLQTFADQAVIAIGNVRLSNETKKAFEQQTATSEILRVISQSPTDVQPVFQTILDSAKRLLGAFSAMVVQRAGDELFLAALSAVTQAGDDRVRQAFPILMEESLTTHPVVAPILNRRPFIISDAETQPDVDAATREIARARGYRSQLVVPLLRENSAIGAISLTRREAGGFTREEIALLQIFADQAVIAIENVRLFKELEARNRDLTESLEQQTATAEILRAIGSSPTDVQPVFDAIARSGVSVCGALGCGVFVVDGDLVRVASTHGVRPERVERFRHEYPIPLDAEIDTAQMIRGRRIFHLADIEHNPTATATDIEYARLAGYRTRLMVPMVRGDRALGLIAVTREAPTPFSDRQVGLLITFAAQAVIAIENVRLFRELEEKNRALTEAHARVSETLDQQTATAEILSVISRSQTDVQPVFETLAENAVRLCAADRAFIFRFDGELLRAAVSYNASPELREFVERNPIAPGRHSVSARAALERQTVQVLDVQADPEYSYAVSDVNPIRTTLAVPMLKVDELVGIITIWRVVAVKAFTETQIALLETFADQAVIAIENVRLLTELQARTQELSRSVGELRALGEVSQAISSTLDLRIVLSTIVARATQLSGTDAGVIYEYDEQRAVFLPRATEHLEAEIVETMLSTPVRQGEGATGRLAEVQEPIQVLDILEAPTESRVGSALVRAGYRALLAIPLLREDHLLGGLTVIRKARGAFAPEVIELLQTFATQSSLAIQNARLFLEIEDKSRQLEAASQHKSEFLANMSHELRTPMNAILGFSEVLAEGMFGEINDKQAEYLRDILESGRHLLSLINDILDLSKIEAGRMELEPEDFHLPSAIDNALTLVRERAGRRGITLGQAIDERVGLIRADERKVKQVLLNLLSNALKFTPEGGRIDVHAALTEGLVELAVADTGVGIAPEDQEAVFEEFRQVGTTDKKVEGTGLGLALSRKFIELHGGRIWVKSEVGKGSTFTFTLPVRRGA